MIQWGEDDMRYFLKRWVFRLQKKVGNNWRGKKSLCHQGKGQDGNEQTAERESWLTGQKVKAFIKRLIYWSLWVCCKACVAHASVYIHTHKILSNHPPSNHHTLLLCQYTFWPQPGMKHRCLSLSSFDGWKTHLWSIAYSASPQNMKTLIALSICQSRYW